MKITIEKKPETIAKEAREQRIKDALANPKLSPTNKDIYQLLLDIAEELMTQ